MNDNKTIKVLRILTLSLTLMLLVFALAKKVGICASSDTISGVSELPFPVGAGYGNNFTSEELTQIISVCMTDCASLNDSSYPEISYILPYDYDSNYYVFRCYYNSGGGFSYDSNNIVFPMSGGTFSFKFGSSTKTRRVYINKSDLSFHSASFQDYSASSLVASNCVTLGPDNNYYSKVNTWVSSYPCYISSDLVYNNVVYFSTVSSGGGIDSPGFSSAFDDAYQEWLDNNSNPLDTNAPSNNTSTPAWLQSILNGLGTLNNTIGGGFATIFNKLKDFTSGVFDFFNDKVVPFFDGITEVTEDIKDILSGSLESDNDIYEAWVDGYEDSVFYDLSNIVSNCKNILTSIFNASTPSTLSFNIPTYAVNIPTTSGASNYVYLFGQSLTIDFSWYRSPIFGGRSIYDMVNSVFFTFLYVGFLAALFFKVPSLIHGSSGFSRAMHGDYNQSMGNASGTPSNSKYDFAAMTQFILDN